MKRQILKQYKDVRLWFATFDVSAVSFDTETTSLKYVDLELEGMSFCNGKQACYIDMKDNVDRERMLEYLKEVFSTKIKTLICHNIVYDMKVLYKYGITCDHIKIYDTMIADHLLDETRRHGLKVLTETFLNEKTISYEEAIKKGSHSDIFYEYATNDAVWTWKLMEIQQDKLKEDGLADLFRRIEMPFQFVLLEMEINGVKVDLEKVRENKNKIEAALLDLEAELHDFLELDYEFQTDLIGNMELKSPYNFNSSQFLTKVLFDDLGLEVVERTPANSPSVGAKTLSIYKKEPFVQILKKYKIAQKLLSAFFIPLPSHIDKDGRVRPSFLDHGTRTGRLSCQNPNLQQLPKVNKALPFDTRECFIASEGYKMIACDYSGQELRVLTEITQEPSLIDTFNKGKDMHLSTANDFFNLGIPEDELYESSDKLSEHKERFKVERNKAKIINFGMAYGKGSYGFSKDFNISEDEAQKILDRYFAALPKVKEAIDNCHEQVRKNGFCKSLTGRRRRFVKEGGFFTNSAFRQSFNFLIQGFSADMIRIAGIKTLSLKKEHPEWDLKIIATVHDEILYECKEEYVEEASVAIKNRFETAVKFCIPIVADVSMGNNYSEAK